MVNEWNRHFSKEIQMAKYSTSLSNGEMQIETQISLVRTATIKKSPPPTKKMINAGKNTGKRNILLCQWECKLVQPQWK